MENRVTHFEQDMNRIIFSFVIVILATSAIMASGSGTNNHLEDPFLDILEAVQADTLPPLEERDGDFITDPNTNPFDLTDPTVIQQEVEYDAETGMYIITEKIGEEYYKEPTFMTFEEYLKYSEAKQRQEYFDRLSRNTQSSGASGKTDPVEDIEIPDNLLDKLFGGTKIDIKPQGSIDLTLGADYQKVENPIIPERQRRQGGFDFDMAIQMNVTGSIGDKLKLGTSYNTQATFDFENQMKLEYAGGEDDIIQKIEAGNVSLPLKSSLIQGSQSLFGIKTELKFGRMTLTGVASQQKSRRNEIQIQGGSQIQTFDVTADSYDENRHFFLSHYNKGAFENALENMPQVNSLFKINRMEVWVTNTRNQTENVRDIVALADLAEGRDEDIANGNPAFQEPFSPANPDIYNNPLPTNGANSMFDIITTDDAARSIDGAVSSLQTVYGLQQAKDFEKVSARMLSTNEYNFHPDLGFVSLNVTLQPEDVLGVAIEYTYNGEVYKIGEFTNDVPIDPEELNVLYVKMLKSTTPRVDVPMWDLMMKNVYSIGAFQVSQEDFLLDIFYEDPGGGEKRFLPATGLNGQPLLQVFNLDNLNGTLDPQPDGRFDFVEGITINSRNGRVMFPKLEPFGSALQEAIVNSSGDPTNPSIIAEANQYTYQQLYDSTIVVARQYPEFNRFAIRGSYRSSVSSEISLGAFNIPRGSVVVRAGGQTLTEGSDYSVDYNIGRVTILNESYLNSGIPLNVSFEDNTLFGFQTKTLLGLRADYKISDNFNVGGTVMKLYERPFTQKVNIGDDPINNNIYGGDIQYTTEAPWLTRVVDAIPLISTKAPSQISFTAEAAYLDPGHANAISQEDQGVVYVDDFEGSTSSLDLRIPANAWTLASIPQNDQLGNNNLFPESALVDDINTGVNRAKLSWYQIDQTGVDSEVGSTAYTETVLITDIFPSFSNPNGFNSILRTLDLTYYPDKRGPYNFDLPAGGTPYSAGLDATGELLEPETRWAGIQRELTTNNFEAANVEYMEFWMLSPFLNEDDGTESNVGDGEFYINLGNVSEDVLRDSRLFFENGLPVQDATTNTDTTNWSQIPRARAVTRSFDNNPENRALQDVGLDGFNDEEEGTQYADYITAIEGATMQTIAKDAILADPSNDNFKYYNDDSFTPQDDIFKRYLNYNNPQGNSQEAGQQVNSATNIPDTEDINKDNTLNETEAYFQYKIPIKRASPGSEEVELNEFIVESITTEATVPRIWYRVKVPVEQYTSRVGGIQDFRSIRFIRMFMTKFDDQTTLRFARFELVRNQWRRYSRSLAESGIGTVIDEGDDTVFDVNDVNVEENSEKQPFRYVLPNGVVREQQIGSAFADALQNEQSLAINVCNLKDGDARGIFKNLNLDIRLFKELKMFVHAEESNDDQIEDGEMTLFMRLGSDFEKNYYEYEIPLSMTRDIADGVSDEEYADLVWPEINELKLKLELLQAVKTERNTTNSALNFLYTIQDPEFPTHTVGVKGNPNLGLVKSVMIGIRNKEDDGLPHCAEIWMNELRMSGFDERGGWGALARLDVQMADFANLNVSTNYTSVGFGGLEQKLIQRSREEVIQYDIATNIELGKFLPEKSGVKIPFYAQYSNTIKNPQYDPYDLDIELKDKLAATPDRATKDEIKKRAQDNTKIKSINLTNVRKERTNTTKKPMPWDVENLSVTYAFSETDRSTPTIARDNLRDNQGIIDYTYSTKANYITPFKKVIKKKNVAKYLKFFTDFNFNPYPNSFSFSTRMHRQFQSTTYRFADDAQATYFDKKFIWDRSYDLKWDLAKSLKFNFNAINKGVIDEPNGAIDQIAKDSIWTNVKKWGRNKDYQHNVNVTFNVPLKSFPFLDFMKVKAQYNANYGWQAGALNLIGEDDIDLGNIIRNGNTRQINGDLDFVTLYNKSKFLKKINSKSKKSGRSGGNRAQNLSSKDKDKKTDEEEEDGKKKKKEKDGEPSAVAKALLRPLMMIRKAKFTYSEQYSSVIPGFTPDHRLLGQSKDFSAPGWDYIFGWRQPDEAWLQKNQEWITESVFLNQQVLGAKTQDINARLTIEPFNDFRIELEADKKESRNNTSYFKKTDAASDFEQLAYREVGSFQISYYTLGTMFQKDYFALFEQFQANREIISERLATGAGITAEHDTDSEYGDYFEGYGRYQLDVLIPSFLAAYNGKSANNVKLNVFKTIPLPNWRISYKGLSKIKGLDKIFSSVSLNHSYKSGLNVNSFNTETDRDGDSPFAKNPNTDNYYSEFEIPSLVISEQLSPLIGIDMRFKNDLTAKLDWKKSRNLAMGFTDYQLSETRSEEFVIGLGYRLKNVYIPFLDFGELDGKKIKGKIDDKKGKKGKDDPKAGGTSKDKKGSDMNFKFDFSWRDDITVNHLLDQGVSVPTRGMKTIRISPSIDYAVNKQLNLRLFYDYSRTIPATSASFPITNTSAGLQIRFSLN